MWLKYTTRKTIYASQQNINLDQYSNGLTVRNIGNSVCVFDGDPLQPGQSKAIGGNKAEILTGRYSFSFQPIANPPIGYVQMDMAIVTEKYYILSPGQEPNFNC
jgi:hypothetical protein